MQLPKMSTQPDGLGYYYGFLPDDPRQINVRLEGYWSDLNAEYWAAYVAGERLEGYFLSREEAVAAAVVFMATTLPET